MLRNAVQATFVGHVFVTPASGDCLSRRAAQHLVAAVPTANSESDTVCRNANGVYRPRLGDHGFAVSFALHLIRAAQSDLRANQKERE